MTAYAGARGIGNLDRQRQCLDRLTHQPGRIGAWSSQGLLPFAELSIVVPVVVSTVQANLAVWVTTVDDGDHAAVTVAFN